MHVTLSEAKHLLLLVTLSVTKGLLITLGEYLLAGGSVTVNGC